MDNDDMGMNMDKNGFNHIIPGGIPKHSCGMSWSQAT